MENRETYKLGNFFFDIGDDAKRLWALYKNFQTLLEKIRVFSRVWSYISILLFAFYGLFQGKSTGAWTLSYIIFVVCALMLVANTVLLCLEKKNRQAEDVRRGVTHAFHWITTVLKLSMTVIVLCGLVTLGDVSSMPMRVTLCLLSVFWMGVTLTVDVLLLACSIFVQNIKDMLSERKERLLVAVKNTAVDVMLHSHPIAKGVVQVARMVVPALSERVKSWRANAKRKRDLKQETADKKRVCSATEDKITGQTHTPPTAAVLPSADEESTFLTKS